MIMRPPKATATRSVGCKVAAAKAANPVPDMAPAAEVAKPVPDMGKRTILNGILVGAAAVPATAMAAGFISFFVPPKYDPASLHACYQHVLHNAWPGGPRGSPVHMQHIRDWYQTLYYASIWLLDALIYSSLMQYSTHPAVFVVRVVAIYVTDHELTQLL